MANIPDSVFQKHQHHDVYIDENPVSKKGKPVPGQLAALRCRTCNNWLKWLSGEELVALGRITEEELDQYRQIKRGKPISLDDLPVVEIQ
jgi:hypothetical protein